MEPVYWLIALLIFLVLEILTMGLTTIWFAVGSLVAAIACILHVSTGIQIILFLSVSIVLLIFTKPVAEKHLNANRVKTNVDSLIGRHGKVLEEIDNFEQTGRVMLHGMEWTARAAVEGEKIPVDTRVSVKEIKGAHLIVEVAPNIEMKEN